MTWGNHPQFSHQFFLYDAAESLAVETPGRGSFFSSSRPLQAMTTVAEVKTSWRCFPPADQQPHDDDDRSEQQPQPQRQPQRKVVAGSGDDGPHRDGCGGADIHLGRGILADDGDIEGAGIQQRSRLHARRGTDAERLLANCRFEMLGIEDPLGSAALDRPPRAADRL
jgi:hypothetical protein